MQQNPVVIIEKSVPKNSFGVLSLLFLIFLTLKLVEIGQVASWSWWWVTSPIWAPLAIVIAIVAVALLGAGIAGVINYLLNRNKWKRFVREQR